MAMVRRCLGGVYFASGVLSALFLIGILSLIVLQMLARWTGEIFPGAPDYAGYAMAAASFFGFSYALNSGAHIRVGIVLNAVGVRARRGLEVWCFAIGTVLAWFFLYHAVRFVYWSWKFNDISQGQDASPLWIPQTSMVLGAFVFAIALTDNLVHVIWRGQSRLANSGVSALIGTDEGGE